MLETVRKDFIRWSFPQFYQQRLLLGANAPECFYNLHALRLMECLIYSGTGKGEDFRLMNRGKISLDEVGKTTLYFNEVEMEAALEPPPPIYLKGDPTPPPFAFEIGNFDGDIDELRISTVLDN